METKELTRTNYSVAEYLELAQASERKLEYYNGRIELMAGGTYEHSSIATDTQGYIARHLSNSSCEANGSDLAVRSEEMNSYLYPDIIYTCEPPEFLPGKNRLFLTNPSLIIEVLSAGTEKDDKGEKKLAYLRLPSLREYVLINSRQPIVYSYYKGEDDIWRIQSYFKMTHRLRLHTLNLEVPLTEIYRRVNFDTHEN